MINLKNKEQLLSHKEYKKYWNKKQKIKENYNDSIFYHARGGNDAYYKKGEQQEFREYLKEIGDLMWKPNGSFQKFCWDLINVHEKEQMNRRARGASSHYRNGRDKFNYY